MDLFLDQQPIPFEFEKNAAEVTLPEDPNTWTNEILQELYKQVSYISDFNTHIVLDRLDAEKGYAFGHVLVSSKSESPAGAPPEQEAAAGIRHARIPIIVKERKLQPFDVVVTDSSRMLPLTEQRLRQALFRPQIFDVTSKTPGDISLIGQLYPPYRQNYGFGGGGAVVNMGMGKTGAAGQPGFIRRAIDSGRRLINAGIETGRSYVNLPSEVAGVRQAVANMGHTIDQQAGALRGLSEQADIHRYAVPIALGIGTAGAAAGGYGLYKAHKLENALNSLPEYQLLQQQEEVVPKTASILSTILPTISESDFVNLASELNDPDVKLAFLRNPPGAAAIARLSYYQPVGREKRAMAIANALRYDTAQVSREGPGQYRLKVASHHMWAPITRTIDRGELVELLGPRVALEVDKTGSVTLADDAVVTEDGPEADHPEVIKDFGLYRVETTDGRKLVGYVFPNLVDVDGTSLPLALFTNGSEYALQSDICGVRAGEGQAIPEGRRVGHGLMFRVLSNGKAEATVPLHIEASLDHGEGVQWIATSFTGDRVRIVPSPNVRNLAAVPGGAILVPDDMRWLTLEGAKEVQLIESPEQMGQKLSAARKAIEIEIRSGGPDSFSLSGIPVEKLGHQATQYLNADDAAFLLVGYGIEPNYAFKKLGQALGGGRPISVTIGRMIKTASEQMSYASSVGQQILELMPELKQPFLVKEASVIPDTMSVDAVLALGFLNPENMLEFLKALPVLDDAQSRMCELLIASRLGLREVPTGALEKAIRAVESVIDGLKVIAFQEDSEKSASDKTADAMTRALRKGLITPTHLKSEFIQRGMNRAANAVGTINTGVGRAAAQVAQRGKQTPNFRAMLQKEQYADPLAARAARLERLSRMPDPGNMRAKTQRGIISDTHPDYSASMSNAVAPHQVHALQPTPPQQPLPQPSAAVVKPAAPPPPPPQPTGQPTGPAATPPPPPPAKPAAPQQQQPSPPAKPAASETMPNLGKPLNPWLKYGLIGGGSALAAGIGGYGLYGLTHNNNNDNNARR